ncbi:penicillin-binding protein [Chitinophagaceae bacterium LB-8]|uniref:Penicillin-binding protein n=1 Tax=Paraflavisolibacter caeni TaxID=2982496 RepID=A0A9X3B9Q4_9BACT|nr:transglycosylase domain-containing protein [Paraflavisolibacter caeni]MCU7552320.1 penicillin-binding protein [Paraflavisolibacter caeni]
MKRILTLLIILLLSGLSILALVVFLVMQGVFGPLPSLKQLKNPNLLQASEVLAADSTLMGKYYRVGGNRSNSNFKDISHYVIDALIATEDERFYKHTGIDTRSTLRAVFLLGRAGGGSTLSQQLALNLSTDRRASNLGSRFIQKIKEYIIATRLEKQFTKQEILTLYLNTVPFGDNVYGIRIAARTFYQKEPSQLKPEEAAVLIGMLKGNSIYNPRLHPNAARDRRNVVLGQMEKNGMLSSSTASQLRALPLIINYKKLDENNGVAPYLREVLKEELKDALEGLEKPDGTPYSLYEDGLRIYTTIDPNMQSYAEEAVAQQMPLLQKALNRQRNIRTGSVWKGHAEVLDAQMKASDRWRNLKDEGLSDDEIKKAFKRKVSMKIFAWNDKREKDTLLSPLDSIKYHRQMLQTAFMVMDPQTGAVKAWVGGINYKTYKFDHANLKTKRQVGSTIKPLLYAQAVEEKGFLPETPVEDIQQDFGGGRLVPATTQSCSGDTITMASALAWSKNCATAYIMKQVEPENFTRFLGRIGVPTEVEPHPSIALGSCDLSLYEMMWAYSIFPSGGISTKPYIISRIEDRNGNVLKRFEPGKNRKEVISEVSAYRMYQMMQGTVTVGTAKGLMERLGAAEMGGKTGTTNDNADAWFMGYAPQLLAGTWIGCDDRFIRIESGLGMGSQAARPIWEAFFKKVYADAKSGVKRDAIFNKPPELLINTDSLVMKELMDAGMMRTEDENPEDLNNPKAVMPPNNKENRNRDPKIGESRQPAEQKEKKGILNKIFGKKEE